MGQATRKPVDSQEGTLGPAVGCDASDPGTDAQAAMIHGGAAGRMPGLTGDEAGADWAGRQDGSQTP